MSSEYPSYEALLASTLNLACGITSLDFLRLHWYLQKDDPRSSITVLQEVTDAKSTEEPYSPTHPIAQAPLTTSPVSSITVSIDILNNYTSQWIDVHSEHAEPRDSPDHSGERFDAEGEVEHCCEQDRPGPGPRVEVVAEPGGFVTIGRFIEVVHPWLRSLDGQLRAAKGVINAWPLDPRVPLCVWPTDPSILMISGDDGMTAENWAHDWALVAKTAAATLRLRNEAGA